MSNTVENLIDNSFSISNDTVQLAVSNTVTSTLVSSVLLAVKANLSPIWGIGHEPEQQYTCTVTNLGLPDTLHFLDTLSTKIIYKADSFTVNGNSVAHAFDPATNRLTCNLGTVATGSTLTIQFRVLSRLQ